MPDVEKGILNAKDNLPEVTPTPPSQQKPQSSAQALKSRLQWGEPALTILDVRERTVFNHGHIRGAMPMPIDELPARAIDSLDRRREIYVYGENDEQSTQAANKLREAGFESVTFLKGGIDAWKAIAGPTEGPAEQVDNLDASSYNVKARLDKQTAIDSKKV
ncbi:MULTISPECIES: rhodanese-like domain-containing protein [unclassified Coleofasciculus]|uniref:rhodanese-like domain-containing protein n=1 Tax=unclassified Coleofasciculus TaxID=2692782 RepID=UPI00187F8E43|nr:MULTISPECIES: rhodanese-like domain-containing protein [unclassified Coleofasciculus]MBE9124816.1 rhodanese-like domain-containing protein [Coleofasciculus sp. LEGE 07081]MBE9147721.1 rhodanese-like domain-containing protein [Coleofasciculus sp. LEGE 07092]